MEKAHELSKCKRTSDIFIDEDITFADMLLSERTLKGLQAAGFQKPSPIQRKAVPYGRCGFDLIIQAKSGTGKTCVFTVVAMEMMEPLLKRLQVIILAPTREISVQIANVISSVCSTIGKIKIESFIGGLPLDQDKRKLRKCQIAVGAPGRVKHLISNGLMDLAAVRLFVLDEADRLMEESFRTDISYIFSKLPLNKQIIAVSATFPEELENFVAEFMNKPIKISPCREPILIGLRQFAFSIQYHPTAACQMRNKTAALIEILSRIPFKQCLVFSNYQSWVESICNEIAKEGWPATFINGSQNQTQRLKAFYTLKQNRCRVLFSTDLTSRGIDVENVNLVVNLDLPYDCATYLHRIGRAGRYGTHGIAVTIIQEGQELEGFRVLMYKLGGLDFHVFMFPKENNLLNMWEANDDQFEKLSSLFGEYKCDRKKVLEKVTEKIPKMVPKKVPKRVPKKISEKVSEYKEDQVKMKKEEATNIVNKCRLQPIQIMIWDTWESLNNDLAKFEIGHSKTPLRQAQKPGIAPIPHSVISGILILENDGWDSFYKEFQLSGKKIAAKSVSNKDVTPKPDLKDVSNPRDEEEGADNSDGNLARFEKSQSGKSGEDVGAITIEINPGYNEIIHNWLSMWRNQSRAITHYVQYYNYWKNMYNYQ